MRKIIAAVLWAWIPFCGQPLRGQSPSEGVKYPKHEKQQRTLGTGESRNAQPDPRAPMVVNVLGVPHKDQKSPEEQAEDNRKQLMDAGMVISAIAAAAFTGALVVIGWFGVRAANRTLKIIERQADLMFKQLAISNRAFFALSEMSEPRNGQACFVIENQGRMPGKLISIDIEIISPIRKNTHIRNWNKIVSADETVPPGKENAFEINIPIPKDTDHSILFSGKVAYDTGFDQTDTFHFIRVYSIERKKWLIAHGYTDVEFDECQEYEPKDLGEDLAN